MKVKIFIILLMLCVSLPASFYGQIRVKSDRVKVYDGTRMDVTGDATIYAGATFILTGDMTVSGNYTNNGVASAFTITSDNAATGSLIVDGSASGTTTVERYLEDNSWHLVTPSTSGVTANDYFWNDAPQSWLMYYTESTSTWSYNTDLSTLMPVGQGWFVWLDANAKSNAIATMQGNLSSSDLPLSLEYSEQGYNAVGNPFPSAIDFSTGSWGFINTEQTIWMWSNSDNNYLYRNIGIGGTLPNTIIPISQGFFVRALGAGPSITIPEDATTHHTQSFYKDDPKTYEAYMTIRSSYAESSDEAWVGFGQNATVQFDNGFDASKFFGAEEAPQIYFREQGRNLSIDYLPFPEGNESIVNMHYMAGKNGAQELVANLDHLEDVGVILEDIITGNTQDLVQNNIYTFQANQEDEPDRFLLHFKSSVFGVGELAGENQDISIYSNNKRIYIRSEKMLKNEKGILILYNLLGKELLRTPIGASELVSVPVQLNSTYAIAKVIKNSAIKTEKIFVK